MSTIVTRAGKGSPLTHTEVDNNFTNLNTDKVEASGGTLTNPTINGTVTTTGLNFDSNTFVIDASNNYVGVGTSSPHTKMDIVGGKLQVSSGGSLGVAGRDAVNIYTSTGARISFYDNSNSVSLGSVQNGGASDLTFATEGTTERMRITSAGNVGIGTSSPAFKLHVNGEGLIGGDSNNGIRFVKSGSINYIQAANAGAASALHIGNWYGDGFMRLDSSGNLGLGVTPSAWSTLGGAALEITQQGNGLSANPNALYYSANAYFASDNWRYAKTGYATQYYVNSNAGSHVWQIAASGTAGNAITFTQAMTLDASGNLGVGLSNPAVRLSVDSGATAIAANFNTTNADGVYVRFQNSGTSIGDIGSGKSVFNGTAGDFGIASRSGNLVLGTGSTERMRIDSSGNVQIGLSGTGDRTLSVQTNTSGSPYLNLSCAGADLGSLWFDRATLRLYARASNTGGVYLASGGTSWTSASDERNKDIIEPITDAITKLGTLRTVIGKYKTDKEDARRPFLIAQDVQAVFPEAVDLQNPDDLGIAYGDMIPLLVKAIQEQQAIINDLKARIETLESK